MLKRMQPKARHNIILLVLNFIYIFVLGLFADTNNINFVYYTCISLIYFASVLVIKDESRYYFYFPAVMIILTWITEFLNFPLLSDITGIISTIFFFGIIVLLIIRVAKSKRVTIVEFLESINIYMLLGIAASDFIYFSFVTITTLGYGDILPVSHLARSLAIMFSVTGQLYLTMIIAMLVGKYLSVNQVNTNPKD